MLYIILQNYLLLLNEDEGRAIADILTDSNKCRPPYMNNGKLDIFKFFGKEFYCDPNTKTNLKFFGLPKDKALEGVSVFAYAIHSKIIFCNIFIQL